MIHSDTLRSKKVNDRLQKRRFRSRLFERICAGVTGLAVLILALLLYDVFVDGYRWVDAQFLNSFPSRFLKRQASSQRSLELYGSSLSPP